MKSASYITHEHIVSYIKNQCDDETLQFISSVKSKNDTYNVLFGIIDQLKKKGETVKPVESMISFSEIDEFLLRYYSGTYEANDIQLILSYLMSSPAFYKRLLSKLNPLVARSPAIDSILDNIHIQSDKQILEKIITPSHGYRLTKQRLKPRILPKHESSKNHITSDSTKKRGHLINKVIEHICLWINVPKRKIILWGNVIIFFSIIIFYLITLHKKEILQVEWAFYGLKENPGSGYEMHSLITESMPTFLDLDNKLSEIKGLPVVNSGDQAQMRFKLNQKAYVYIFHFDTTFSSFKQLFPSYEIQQSNPVSSNSSVEIPPERNTWRFDSKSGLEVFLCYVSLEKSNKIKKHINEIINNIKMNFSGQAIMLNMLQKQLSAIVPIKFQHFGVYEHHLSGITPNKVQTCVYQSQNKESVLLLQFIRHE